MNKKMYKLEQQLDELKIEKKALEKYIQDTKNARQESNMNRDDYQAYRKVLEAQMEDLKKKIQEIEAIIHDLKEKIDQNAIDREELLKELNGLQAELKGLESIILDLQNEIENLELQLSTSQGNDKKQLQTRIYQLKKELRNKKANKAEIKEKINGVAALANEKKMNIGLQIIERNNKNNYKVGKQEILSSKKTQERQTNRNKLREQGKEKFLQAIFSQNQDKLSENISNSKQIVAQIDATKEKIEEVQKTIQQLEGEIDQKASIERNINFQMNSLRNQINHQKYILNDAVNQGSRRS